VAKKPNQLVVSKTEIGARVRLLRQQQGLTQVELAARLDMTQSNLSAIERGARGVTVHQVVRIAKALRASTDEILLHGEAPEPTRRPKKRLMKRLQRIEELPDRDQRIVLQLLEGLVMRHQERALRRPKHEKPSAPDKPHKDSKIA
jgi:transcriptional regulator with XRE-family HTH domain